MLFRSPAFPDFMNVEPYTMASSMQVYGYSKLLLTTFTEELARRASCSVLTLCPGAMNTNIAREAPPWTRPLLKVVFAMLFRSAQKAAEPVLFLAASPAFDGSTGDYLHLLERKAKDPRALDPALGRRLWDATDDLLRPRLPAT